VVGSIVHPHIYPAFLAFCSDVGGSVDAHTHSIVNADVSKEDEVKQLLDNIRSRWVYSRLDFTKDT
jgi:hypothetical protein